MIALSHRCPEGYDGTRCERTASMDVFVVGCVGVGVCGVYRSESVCFSYGYLATCEGYAA